MNFNLAVILRETAHATPDQPVTLFAGSRMTYRELDELSDRLAAFLHANGTRPGTPIALQLPNIPQFLIAYFGILKAGCVVVPLNVLLKGPEVASQNDLDSYYLSTLRVAISGGASIPAPVLDEFERTFGVLILEGYGLTETASTTTFNRSVSDRRVYSVGQPSWGTQTQVWSEQRHPLPPGRDHVGEVVTRGLHVMKGYLNSPQANAEVFTGEWFHTGDLGYFDEDGFLFIVNRIKELIIRGGYNVYPAEIADVLHEHPAVAEAAVVGIPDNRLGEEVKAVVTVRPGAELTAAELIAYCKERMAAYQYPRVIEIRSGLPKNSMGKILKDQLVAPEESAMAES